VAGGIGVKGFHGRMGRGYGRRVRFGVLGSLDVSDGDLSIALGGHKQRLVLAHLVLAANQAVPTEHLIDAVWGDEPPDSAKSTLQTYISRLRSALGSDAIEALPPGYVLHAASEDVDAVVFEHLLHRARGNVDPNATALMLADALELWRGPALADLASEPSLMGEVARLEELRLQAVEEKIAAELQLGHLADVVAELETLTRTYRLRERLWGQLMLALYRLDRQADAILAYERARSLLADELGIDPSPELRRLHERILRQDPDLALSGKPLRGYQLLEQIGEGAFGVVYRATQPQIGREVAIKAVPPELANHPDFVRRFEREAQIVARLEHPHIVPLYDYWREPDAAYLVMRFLRGGSLEQLLESGPLKTDEAARILDQVAAAVAAAHRQGVIHRDVKPGNILLDEEGNAYLTDFGVALDAGAPERSSGTMIRGTPGYLSPEQIRLEPASPRTDVYALGIVLYEMLAGQHPFPADNLTALLDHQIHDALPSVRNVRPELASAVDRAIERATAKDTEARFSDALELALTFRQAIEEVARDVEPIGEIRNPYKGLRAFLEADAGDFFGREALASRLVRRLNEDHEASRFLAVVGPSGSGKSSVVRAGLVPALRSGAIPGSDRWYVIELLPGARPLRELETALLGVAVEPPSSLLDELERDETGLLRAVDRVLPDRHSELLIVLDQLEEVFTLVQDEGERAHVLASMRAAVMDPDSRVRIVTTLRADFFDQPLSVRGFGEVLAARTEAITPMSLEELERAIVAPADRAGFVVEPRLLAAMITDVADRPGALPFLQYALTELADRATVNTLSLEEYGRIGGITGALAQRAEQLFQAMNETGRSACRQLFMRLVALGEGNEDTRRRVRRSALEAIADRRTMDAVIESFGRHRLLSFDRDPDTREPTVEIAHEALLRAWSRLHGWIDGGRDDIRTQRQLATATGEWESSDRDPSFLLRGARLEQTTTWAEKASLAKLANGEERWPYLNEPERQFLDQSRALSESEAERERRVNRRLRALLSGVALLLVLAMIAGGLFLVQRNRAERQATVADAQRLGAQAIAQDRLDLALLLAREAVELDDSVQARAALFTTLLRGPNVIGVFDVGSQVQAVAAVGDTLAVSDEDGVTLFDSATREKTGQLAVRDVGMRGVGMMIPSPDGRTLATAPFSDAGAGAHVQLWDVQTGRRLLEISPQGNTISSLAFGPEGRWLGAIVDQSVITWDMHTGAEVGRPIHLEQGNGIWHLAVAPDGRHVITSLDLSPSKTASEETIIWGPRTREPKRTFPVGGNMTLSPDGRTVALGNDDGSVRLLDLQSARVRLLPEPSSPLSPLAFSPDGQTLASSGEGASVILWDVASGSVKETLSGSAGQAFTLTFAPEGETLYGSSFDSSVIEWDAGGTRSLGRLLHLRPTPNGSIPFSAYSHDGSLLAVPIGNDIHVFDARRLTVVRSFEDVMGANPFTTYDLEFSPDDTRLAVTSFDASSLIDVRSGSVIARFPSVRLLGYKPDGGMLWGVQTDSVTGRTRLVRLNARTGGIVSQVQLGRYEGFVLSPDATQVAAFDRADRADIWDLAAGTQLFSVAVPRFGLVFSPDSHFLAVAGQKDDVLLLNAHTGRSLGRPLSGPLGLTPFGFDESASVLATAGSNGDVQLWDVASRQQIAAIPPPTSDDGFHLPLLSPDGRHLAIMATSGLDYVWDIDPADWKARACAVAGRNLTRSEWQQFLPDRLYQPVCPT
jgi:serine/threonine protein kinase/WD40 repeat protein